MKDDLDEAVTKVRPTAVGPKANAVMLDVAAIKSIVHARPVTFMIAGIVYLMLQWIVAPLFRFMFCLSAD